MLEEGLNCLPSYKRTVVTPTGESWDLITEKNHLFLSISLSLSHTHTLCPGQEYEGEWFEKLNCAVSILRSGVCVCVGIQFYIELELPQQYAFKLFASILHNCVCVSVHVCVCVCVMVR